MMDKGDDVPSALREQTNDSIQESLLLLDEWHGRADGRIRYCFAPRFAVSCTKELLERVGALAREKSVMVHTHASENPGECALVEAETGMRNIVYLNSVRLTGPHVALAHCVHLNEQEKEILRTTRTNVVHCPSSNLKLGSGIAEIVDLLDRGVAVSLGADGAPCNNRLDMFTEMRTAALLQKGLHGPEALNAHRALQMATIDGARAMGLEAEVGSLETGKRADVSVVKLERIHNSPRLADLASALVYAAQATDVIHVLVDGNPVLTDGNLVTLDEKPVLVDVETQASRLLERAGVT
jgi:5-methylthioadenosine/S-adenosylhomocysteine deaminase